ncbi:MAG: hypothetical protein M1836_002342 [Candelina mexicana]|nr:MAG: hypothetical protein M1836_002342 [Candelina mexicana]
MSLPAATQQAQPNQQRPAVASDYEPRIPTSRVSPAIVVRSSLELYPRSSHNQHHRDRHTHRRHMENRSTRGGGPQDNPQVQSAPQCSILIRVLIFLLGNALVGALTYYLCLVVVEPYHHRSVAESHTMMTVLYIIVISVALAQCYGNMFFWKVVKDIALWCRGASDIRNWGRYRQSRFPELKQKCSIVVLHFMLCFGVCFFSILVLGPFAGTILAPMVGREHEFKSVCDGFDTRIELDFDAAWPYHSILFRNQSEPNDARPLSMRYSTEFSPLLRTNITTLVVNQEEMTQSEKSAHGLSYNAPAFLASNFAYDTIAYDFVNGHWSTTLDGTLQRNGSFVHSYKDLILPELGLQIPDFADFERNCIYEPFVKVHRGSGDATELDRQRGEKFTHNNDDIVLRTASFGWSQGALNICAQKESTVSENGVILRKGLGDDLPVVAGLIATLRYDGFMRKTRRLCGSWGVQKVSDSGYQWSLPA